MLTSQPWSRATRRPILPGTTRGQYLQCPENTGASKLTSANNEYDIIAGATYPTSCSPPRWGERAEQEGVPSCMYGLYRMPNPREKKSKNSLRGAAAGLSATCFTFGGCSVFSDLSSSPRNEKRAFLAAVCYHTKYPTFMRTNLDFFRATCRR